MQYVEQREDWDCVIACLAMVTEIPYEFVLDDMQAYCDKNEGTGIGDDAFYEFLAEHGFVVQTFYEFYTPLQRNRVRWPLPPFAPIHVVGVIADGIEHSVVMTWNGVIYDPEDMAKVGLWEYEKVNEIVGIWPNPKR